MKHLTNLDQFPGLKKGETINESAISNDRDLLLIREIAIPKSLIAAFAKKVKDDSGQDIKVQMGDEMIGDKILKYVLSTYFNIDNLPVSLMLGDNYKKVQIQPSDVAQPATQPDDATTQPAAQPTAQPADATAQPVEPAQQTAAQIPAQEGGTQGQAVQTQATTQQI